MCQGRGEIQSVQRSFLGQVMTARACPQCQGFGTTIPHPCPECSGDGRVRTRRTLSVQIPPGVDTGTRIQLTGEGEVGPGGGPAGDLYVEIVETPHPVFQRRGDDLHCTVQLPMTAAALGTTVAAGDARRHRDVDIAPGTQSGQSHAAARPWRAAPAGHRPRRPHRARSRCRPRPGSTPSRSELLRELAALRDEEKPERHRPAAAEPAGCSRRIKDAFSASDGDARRSSWCRPTVAAAARSPGGRRGHRGRGPSRGLRAAAARRQSRSSSSTARRRRRRPWSAVSGPGPASTSTSPRSPTSRRRAPLGQSCQALPKGDRGDLAVELLTEVGVDAIVPWAASRCVAVWRGDKADGGVRQWRAVTAREAAKQAAGARVPDVAEPLARRTAAWSPGCTAAAAALCCTRRATGAWPTCGARPRRRRAGRRARRAGSADDELAALAAAGGASVRLGPRCCGPPPRVPPRQPLGGGAPAGGR